MQHHEQVILDLLAASITHKSELSIKHLPIDKDGWARLGALSTAHGITGILFETIKELPEELLPPIDKLIEMMGIQQLVITQSKNQAAVIAEVSQILYDRGIPCIILKGLSYGSYYDHPLCRVSGDIDCFLDGYFDNGNTILVENGAIIGEGDYKHSHLTYKGVVIENHRYLTDFDETKIGVETEKNLRRLLSVESPQLLCGKALKPSDSFNGLFLLKHAQHHFLNEGITLRHLVDWAVFVQSSQNKIDWEVFINLLKRVKLYEFANALTVICRDYLYVETSNLGGLNSENTLTRDLLTDIFHQTEHDSKSGFVNIMRRVICRLSRKWKYKRFDSEPFYIVLKNTVLFSSYLHREINREF